MSIYRGTPPVTYLTMHEKADSESIRVCLGLPEMITVHQVWYAHRPTHLSSTGFCLSFFVFPPFFVWFYVYMVFCRSDTGFCVDPPDIKKMANDQAMLQSIGKR